MRHTRLLAPASAGLGLIFVLAACAPSGADAPSQRIQPPAESLTASPTLAESPTASPTPAESPSPETGDVVELDLPMIARSTADDVAVYAIPSTDGPLLVGEQFPDMNRIEISLSAGEGVYVALGPLVSDGTSWYQVSSVDGGPTAFGFGWVSAEFLVREADSPQHFPRVATNHGQGSGGEISVGVLVGTPVTVDVGAAPTEDQESCDLDVTLVRSDGQVVNVATQTVSEPDAFQLGASIEGNTPGLFQDEAGTVTLKVETDCSWTAALTQPAG